MNQFGGVGSGWIFAYPFRESMKLGPNELVFVPTTWDEKGIEPTNLHVFAIVNNFS